MVSVYGAFISYQVNVDQNGQNILGDAANECAISVDPTNGSKMTIAWRQFNDVTSNFRQGGWGYTTDAGVHWTFPGILQNNVFRSDPVTQSDEAGQFFYLSLQSNAQPVVFLRRPLALHQRRSNLDRQSPDRSAGGDKEWLTIDRTNGPGHGFQYQINDSANCAFTSAAFQRSTNGGMTWQKPGGPSELTHIRDPRCRHQRQRFCRWLDRRHRISLRALKQRTDRGPDTLF